MTTSRKILLMILWLAVAVVFGLVLPLFLVNRFVFGHLCKNEIRTRYPAPDGKHEVVVFDRDCGATSGFNTQASMLAKGDELPDDSDNLFVADTNHGEAPTGELRVQWDGPGILTLSHHEKCRVFHAEKERDGVHVRYITFR